MRPPLLKIVGCDRCGHRWQVNVSELGRPKRWIYKNEPNQRQETFRLQCPNCQTPNMLDATFEVK